jgi:arylsulfatase
VPQFNRVETTFDEMFAHLDDWGGPDTAPHYAVGWAMAGNTPNRWYKRFTHEGGTRSPLIVHWPERISDRGAIRSQFHHVVDVMPTVLDCLNMEMLGTVRGYQQRPLDGLSFAYTLRNPDEPTRKTKQYFEMLGHRSIWADGWKAVTMHRSAWVNELLDEPDAAPAEFDADRWELYNLDEDFSESNDRADEDPDRVRQLSDLWWREAEQHQVLPLEGRWQMGMTNPPSVVERRNEYAFYGPVHLTANASPVVRNRSHRITATVDIPEGGAEGVIVADGGQLGGYALFIKDGLVAYASSYLGRETIVRARDGQVRPGSLTITVQFDKTREHAGRATLRVGNGEPSVVDIPRTNPALYDLRGGGFHIGADDGGVSSTYSKPFPFTGRIVSVLVGRPDPEYHDTSMELKEALREQ